MKGRQHRRQAPLNHYTGHSAALLFHYETELDFDTSHTWYQVIPEMVEMISYTRGFYREKKIPLYVESCLVVGLALGFGRWSVYSLAFRIKPLITMTTAQRSGGRGPCAAAGLHLFLLCPPGEAAAAGDPWDEDATSVSEPSWKIRQEHQSFSRAKRGLMRPETPQRAKPQRITPQRATPRRTTPQRATPQRTTTQRVQHRRAKRRSAPHRNVQHPTRV